MKNEEKWTLKKHCIAFCKNPKLGLKVNWLIVKVVLLVVAAHVYCDFRDMMRYMGGRRG